MLIEPEKLKDIILKEKIIQPKELSDILKEVENTGLSFEDVLMKREVIKEKDLYSLYAKELDFPFIDLSKESISKDILKIIPEPTARQYNIVAFEKDKDNLKVAMLDPKDIQILEFLKKKTNLQIVPYLTTPESIRNVLKQYQVSLEAEFSEIIKKEAGEAKTDGKDLAKLAEELPVVRIVDTLLKHAILQNSSDIHIEPTEKEIIVRYRIDGILRDAMILPKELLSAIVARIKILTNLKIDEHRLPQDGRFKIESEDYKFSFRVSILPVFDGEKVVMRLLRESGKATTLEELGLSPRDLKVVKRNIVKPHGMILITGPTGSGKTTTLYAMMDILNTKEVNISTIEDPIEYRMPRINQTQVKPEIGLTFANGLRSLVRQDPDIIMVGEIRDLETAEMAIHSSLTGHLVLSTLHTNNAAGSLPRLIDMGIEPFLIGSTVILIIGQRLVRKICPDCKTAYKLTKEEVQEFGVKIDIKRLVEVFKEKKLVKENEQFTDLKFYRGKGCERCRKEGYSGRIGIFEALEITDEISNMLSQKITSEDLEQAAIQKTNMITMVQDGMAKALQGITTIEEVLRVSLE